MNRLVRALFLARLLGSRQQVSLLVVFRSHADAMRTRIDLVNDQSRVSTKTGQTRGVLGPGGLLDPSLSASGRFFVRRLRIE